MAHLDLDICRRIATAVSSSAWQLILIVELLVMEWGAGVGEEWEHRTSLYCIYSIYLLNICTQCIYCIYTIHLR